MVSSTIGFGFPDYGHRTSNLIICWRYHSLGPFFFGLQVDMLFCYSTLDFQWGGYQICWIIHHRVLQGVPIIPLLGRIPKYLEWCLKLKHDLVIRMIQAAQLVLYNMIGATPDELTFMVPGPGHSHLPVVQTPKEKIQTLTEGGDGTTSLSTAAAPMTTADPTMSGTTSATAASAAGSTMTSTLIAAAPRLSRAERLVGLSPLAITEEEFITAVERSKLTLSLTIFLVWKSRALFLHGHLDRAWTTIQRAMELREFIQRLSPECELVFVTALILLAKIGRILVHISIRQSPHLAHLEDNND
jgi:hypothetical protein